PDQRRPVAGAENSLVAMRLAAAPRRQDDGVAEVNAGPGGVEAQLDAQPVAALGATLQMLAVDDLYRARAHRVPGAVIRVLSLLHRFVTRSRRRVYTRLTKLPVLF